MENSTVKLVHKVIRITDKPGTHEEEVFSSRYKGACVEYISEQPNTNVYVIRMIVTTSIDESTMYGGKNGSGLQAQSADEVTS